METNQLQDKINKIIDLIDTKTNCKHDINNTFFHLIEELGELANELNKPNIRNEQITKENLEEEIADILLLTTRIANLNNISIEKAILEKIEKLKLRHNLNHNNL